MVLASRFSPNRGRQRAITSGPSEAARTTRSGRKYAGRPSQTAYIGSGHCTDTSSQKSQDVSGIKSNAMNYLANWRARRDIELLTPKFVVW